MVQEQEKYTPDELYMQWMEDFHKESKQRENYSNARLDLLTISICGAGLYICLETLKFLLENPQVAMPSWPVKVAGALFTVAIAVNFWSQHTGKRTNLSAAQWARFEALKEKSGQAYPEQDKWDKDRECFARLTKVLNVISTVVMVVAVMFLVTVYVIFL